MTCIRRAHARTPVESGLLPTANSCFNATAIPATNNDRRVRRVTCLGRELLRRQPPGRSQSMIRQHGARPRPLLTLAGLLLLLLITAVQPAFAASFVVSKTADTNDGTCN